MAADLHTLAEPQVQRREDASATIRPPAAGEKLVIEKTRLREHVLGTRIGELLCNWTAATVDKGTAPVRAEGKPRERERERELESDCGRRRDTAFSAARL